VPGECSLLFTGPLDGFVLRFKVAGIAGAVLSAPLWLYQLWAFITPGLRRNERRWTVAFVLSSTVLFAAGAFLSYLTIAKALGLLVNLAGPGTVAAIEVTRYLGFVMTMLLVFGVSFELPLLTVLLNMVGILSYRRLLRWQRMTIFLIFVFAAVATPSQDPISMCMLAIPMCLLFEGAVLVAFLHDRRKQRRRAVESFHDLPDDVASPLDAPARDRIERRRPHGFAGAQVEAGVVPGADDAPIAEHAFDERSAVVRAASAEGVDFTPNARQQNVGPVNRDLFHLSVFQFAPSGNRYVLLCHKTFLVSGRSLLSALVPVAQELLQPFVRERVIE
jgi:sec-independent protein translocase protein TatC